MAKSKRSEQQLPVKFLILLPVISALVLSTSFFFFPLFPVSAAATAATPHVVTATVRGNLTFRNGTVVTLQLSASNMSARLINVSSNLLIGDARLNYSTHSGYIFIGVAGLFFVLASFFKFHQHKSNPTQRPIDHLIIVASTSTGRISILRDGVLIASGAGRVTLTSSG